MEIKQELWGKTPCGKDISKYTLTNSKGAYVELCDFGAAIVSIVVPDKDGKLGDVALGYDKAESYVNDSPFFGKVPGRFANRIKDGRFTIDGVEYQLPVNNGANHLHGGPKGFSEQLWEGRIENEGVEFMYFSPDGEEGYPGNLKVVARYEWDEDNALKLTFTAQCDKKTVINLTNHVYFNLNGCGDIKGHVLSINASEFLPTNESLIPLGEPAPVAGTPMDFNNPKTLGQDLFSDYEAIKVGKGFDSSWIVDGYQKGQLQDVCELYSPETGRLVRVISTQPAVQVYTGNYIGGTTGKGGVIYNDYDGVALECQHFPDSPNQPEYPTTQLNPGETFEEAIIFQFSTK